MTNWTVAMSTPSILLSKHIFFMRLPFIKKEWQEVMAKEQKLLF